MRILSVCLAALFAAVTSASASEGIESGRGVNLGNYLEAAKEGAWSGGRLLKESDFTTIAQAGFNLIRVPINWSGHAGDGPAYTIDPAFFRRVDWVVAQAEQDHLRIVLDYHTDKILFKNPDTGGDRFIAIWKQIAEHYQEAPSTVLFELLNEPNGKLDAPHWNALVARTLPVLRKSNPIRMIVVGPVHWNGIGSLPGLVLPEDDHHLLVTVHYYDPMKFTHQGASWIKDSAPWLGTTWEGTSAEKQAVADAFDKAAKWGEAHQRPMFLGEFGSYEMGDFASRVRWTECVRKAADAHGFTWTYWEFSEGFGVYDPKTNQWREPLLEALLPKR